MDRHTIERALRSFSLFTELNEHEMEQIINISVTRSIEKGQHIFMQSDPLENVYFILNGKVKIYKSDASGKEQIVAILKQGDMFPHVGFFRKGTYPAFAEVIHHASIVVVPIQPFEKILITHPELCIKVFKVLGEKIVDLQDRLEAQILNNTYGQILKLFIQLGESHGVEISDGRVLLKNEFTNRDLANMIGTTRETVSRTMTKMKKDGLLHIDEKGNMIYHPDELLDEII